MITLFDHPSLLFGLSKLATRRLRVLHQYSRILLDSQRISDHHPPDLTTHHALHISQLLLGEKKTTLHAAWKQLKKTNSSGRNHPRLLFASKLGKAQRTGEGKANKVDDTGLNIMQAGSCSFRARPDYLSCRKTSNTPGGLRWPLTRLGRGHREGRGHERREKHERRKRKT